jgi:hypothetical protein
MSTIVFIAAMVGVPSRAKRAISADFASLAEAATG